MNVFAYPLAEGEVAPAPATSPTKFVVDDNIGEAVHIHYRNLRMELSVADFRTVAENMARARGALDDGHR